MGGKRREENEKGKRAVEKNLKEGERRGKGERGGKKWKGGERGNEEERGRRGERY